MTERLLILEKKQIEVQDLDPLFNIRQQLTETDKTFDHIYHKSVFLLFIKALFHEKKDTEPFIFLI